MILVRESQTAVLERGATLEDHLVTEPFEVAWATEARWFVQFLETDPDATVVIKVQISPDGLAWVDHEMPATETPAAGLITVPVQSFGHWIRLRLDRTGGSRAALTRIYLALKE